MREARRSTGDVEVRRHGSRFGSLGCVFLLVLALAGQPASAQTPAPPAALPGQSAAQWMNQMVNCGAPILLGAFLAAGTLGPPQFVFLSPCGC